MTNRYCLYVGATTATNVRHLVDNVGWMVEGTADLDLLTTASDALGAATRHYSVPGDTQPSTVRGHARALDSYLTRNDPAAVVQLTRPPTHGTLVAAIARRHGVPFVYRYAGDRFYEYRVARGRQRLIAFALGNLLNRIPVRLADHRIALGPRGRDRLVAHGADPETITVLPPAVDTTRFDAPPDVDLSVPEDRSVALFLGRLSHLKGRDAFETAIPRVLARRDDFQFVFVGAGDLPDVPPRYADHVTAAGHVSPDEIPGYTATADVLVHPSLTEGLPRVLLESLVAGTPVLARDVGDVASVTDNTFETDAEFVEMLLDFESLPLDDVTPFTREALAPAYRAFARRLTEDC